MVVHLSNTGMTRHGYRRCPGFAVSSPCLAQKMRLHTSKSWSIMACASLFLAALSTLMPRLMKFRAVCPIFQGCWQVRCRRVMKPELKKPQQSIYKFRGHPLTVSIPVQRLSLLFAFTFCAFSTLQPSTSSPYPFEKNSLLSNTKQR